MLSFRAFYNRTPSTPPVSRLSFSSESYYRCSAPKSLAIALFRTRLCAVSRRLTASNLIAPVTALKQVCDERAAEYEEGSRPQGFDPRCRPWYQDAVEHGRVIFTNPYVDVGSGELIVTVAAPVYNSSDTTLLLGVVGIDMDFTEIDDSIKDLRVIDDEGYAYLLAPGGEGEVAVHNDLQADEGTKNIMELESGVDTEEFDAIVTLMSDACTGFETYSRDGSTWMLSWSHETTSVSTGDGTDVCGDGGFIAVVTVDEATLLEVREKWKS